MFGNGNIVLLTKRGYKMNSVCNLTSNFFICNQEFEMHFHTHNITLYAVVDRKLVFICNLRNSYDAEERARIWMGI